MNEGFSTPILVVWDSGTPHRFSGYITEILDIEGYNWRVVHDLASDPLTADVLEGHQIVILTHIDPPDDVQDLLLEYVRGGGNLIALRPPRKMAGKLGLNSSSAERSMVDRYVSFSSICALNAGVDHGPIQFHGRGEHYTWGGGEPNAVVAYFAAKPDYVTPNPAILIGGLGDGHWSVFAYDLAESTVLFHQGRREQASDGARADADGARQFIPNDLFVGFLDPDLRLLPQADLHQDALVRVIEWIASITKPLPRVWHFPDGAPAVAFLNGDSDNMDARDFWNIIATTDRYGVPFTTYLKPEHHEIVEPEVERSLVARGHDFGEHPFVSLMPTKEEMRNGLREEMGAFRARYGHDPVTNRGHSVVWVGWTDQAKYLRENGVRLDTSFAGGRYHRTAYVNGSGLPVKFMDENGELLDIYEQNTMSSDDGMTTDKCFERALSIDECIEVSKRQIDASIDRFHTVYHPYFHPHAARPAPRSIQRWVEAAIQHCQGRGFPFVNGTGWVDFNDGRRSLLLTSYSFDERSMSIEMTLAAGASVDGAALALPYVYRGLALGSATVDGEPVATEPTIMEGREQVTLCADYREGEPRTWRVQWGQG